MMTGGQSIFIRHQGEEVATQTVARLEAVVDRYEGLRATIEALEREKTEMREAIIQAFKTGGMEVFDDSKGRRTSISTRLDRRISYREAEALLDADTLGKLVRESIAIVVLVRAIPKGGQ